MEPAIAWKNKTDARALPGARVGHARPTWIGYVSETRGRVGRGISGMAGSVGGMLFFQVAGRVLEATGNYALLFAICAAAYGAGFLALHAPAPKLARIEV